MRIRDQLVQQLWRGNDPFEGFDRSAVQPDKQGWSSAHQYLRSSIEEIRPKIIIEIGVWKGGSAITMASALRELGIDGVVIAIDTFLGSAEHWLNSKWFSSLNVSGGYPTLQRTFMANILDEGLEKYVVPFPIDSLNALAVAKRLKWQAQLIHIDGGHDFESVQNDVRGWWKILEAGGILIGDDYRTDGSWAEVRQAFDSFVLAEGVSLEHSRHKCRIRKPAKTQVPLGV